MSTTTMTTRVSFVVAAKIAHQFGGRFLFKRKFGIIHDRAPALFVGNEVSVFEPARLIGCLIAGDGINSLFGICRPPIGIRFQSRTDVIRVIVFDGPPIARAILFRSAVARDDCCHRQSFVVKVVYTDHLSARSAIHRFHSCEHKHLPPSNQQMFVGQSHQSFDEVPHRLFRVFENDNIPPMGIADLIRELIHTECDRRETRACRVPSFHNDNSDKRNY